ncbi:STAS domain-containing protein [Undibacterium fentianense]|uniref:STAS domain-containing protein n=1 Tax=Undibacterium fentianense TaxID=2828728 RepID=A0A941E433_9BURK|nr:STAS domain-containing protein [Undibacterium fentianense]MBR7800812.1 STAS domain-containing protein [Undibacterium fentianense]
MVLQDQELNLRNAVSVSEAGLRAIHAGDDIIDMTALESVDSSAVAVMLAWQRRAQATNRKLRFVGVSSSLFSLISLYGLTDFFHLSASIQAERH